MYQQQIHHDWWLTGRNSGRGAVEVGMKWKIRRKRVGSELQMWRQAKNYGIHFEWALQRCLTQTIKINTKVCVCHSHSVIVYFSILMVDSFFMLCFCFFLLDGYEWRVIVNKLCIKRANRRWLWIHHFFFSSRWRLRWGLTGTLGSVLHS